MAYFPRHKTRIRSLQDIDDVPAYSGNAGYILRVVTNEDAVEFVSFSENVQDIVGAMVSSNTETAIGVTYDDPNGKLDFEVQVDDSTIEVDGTNNYLQVKDDGITKEKINANVAGDGLGQNADGSLEINYNSTFLDISADTLNLNADVRNILDYHIGSTIENTTFSVSSDGATVTGTFQKSGGGDLTLVFDNEYYDLDCTPALTVSLTAGTDTVPQRNYVYVPYSTKALTANTTGFPTGEAFIPVVAEPIAVP